MTSPLVILKNPKAIKGGDVVEYRDMRYILDSRTELGVIGFIAESGWHAYRMVITPEGEHQIVSLSLTFISDACFRRGEVWLIEYSDGREPLCGPWEGTFNKLVPQGPFGAACAAHDEDYTTPDPGTTRAQADWDFLVAMWNLADKPWHYPMAMAYYAAVRVGGWAFFDPEKRTSRQRRAA